MIPKIPTKYLGLFLIFFHAVGVVGTLYSPTKALVVSLTPVNLLLSLAIILMAQQKISTRLIAFTLIAFVFGLAIEIIGVHSGIIFGQYEYGNTLGHKTFGTPLIMGVNWFLLTYAFGIISNYFRVNLLLRVIIGALGMVLMDFLIEPIAISLDYWHWHNGEIPLQNYFGWFFASIPIQFLFQSWLKEDTNPIGIYLIISQLTYFLLILLFL